MNLKQIIDGRISFLESRLKYIRTGTDAYVETKVEEHTLRWVLRVMDNEEG